MDLRVLREGVVRVDESRTCWESVWRLLSGVVWWIDGEGLVVS